MWRSQSCREGEQTGAAGGQGAWGAADWIGQLAGVVAVHVYLHGLVHLPCELHSQHSWQVGVGALGVWNKIVKAEGKRRRNTRYHTVVLSYAVCRYRLVKEQPNRPAGDALDYIIMQALDPEGAAAAVANGEKQENRSLLDTVGATIGSMQRFMKSLSQ